MLETWRIEKENSAGFLAQSISNNGPDLPPALPWVEPSINNLWLEACRSFLFGNYQASIITTSVLLELTLRMVLANREDIPSIRDDHEQLFDKDTLAPVINAAKTARILSGKSKKWWKAYCEHIRNKICHGDLLYILDDCRHIKPFEKYFDPTESPDITASYGYEYVITHPAAFHHKSGRKFSKAFLDDAYNELTTLITQTEWGEYADWWKSQKQLYDSFFSYKWGYATLKQGIQDAKRPFGSSSK